MTQLFHIKCQTHWEDAVEINVVLVCADSADSAIDIILSEFSLPQSRTTLNIGIMKPELFIVERRKVPKPVKGVAADAPTEPRDLVAVGSLIVDNEKMKRSREKKRPRKFLSSAYAVITATDEEHALRRLCEAMTEKLRGETNSPFIDGLTIRCDHYADQRSTGTMEQVELYKARRFVRG